MASSRSRKGRCHEYLNQSDQSPLCLNPCSPCRPRVMETSSRGNTKGLCCLLSWPPRCCWGLENKAKAMNTPKEMMGCSWLMKATGCTRGAVMAMAGCK